MGRRSKKTDCVSIVEACYQITDSDDAWLAHVFQTAAPALDTGGGLGLSLVQETPRGRQIVLSQGVGRVNAMLQLSWPVIEQLDDAIYHRFFYPREPVVLASRLVNQFGPSHQNMFSSLMQHAGASDLLGMLGYPSPGWAFAMFVGVGNAPLTPQVHRTLRRLRIHVEASLRMRLFSSADAVAVIHPDGRLAHAEEEAQDPATCRLLAAQALAIERARGRQERADSHRALEVWQALVKGRWSLVEKVDSDQRRYYYAFENAPHVYKHRALTEGEADVLTPSLRGETGKLVAYQLGRSPSWVSTALKRAAEKLGFSGREELLRVGARLLDQRPTLRSATLTVAEQEVRALVRQGYSNREIARKRRTSVHTVANQLSSLLRKTGVGSRRGLLVGAP